MPTSGSGLIPGRMEDGVQVAEYLGVRGGDFLGLNQFERGRNRDWISLRWVSSGAFFVNMVVTNRLPGRVAFRMFSR